MAFYFTYLLHSPWQNLQLPRGKGHKRTSRSHTKVPHLTHLTPHSLTKDSHSTGITLLFSNNAWVLLRPTELSTFKELWDGTFGLSSLSEKTRKSNHLQMKLQRQHFLLSYFKDPECRSGRSLKLTTCHMIALCTTKWGTGAHSKARSLGRQL